MRRNDFDQLDCYRASAERLMEEIPDPRPITTSTKYITVLLMLDLGLSGPLRAQDASASKSDLIEPAAMTENHSLSLPVVWDTTPPCRHPQLSANQKEDCYGSTPELQWVYEDEEVEVQPYGSHSVPPRACISQGG